MRQSAFLLIVFVPIVVLAQIPSTTSFERSEAKVQESVVTTSDDEDGIPDPAEAQGWDSKVEQLEVVTLNIEKIVREYFADIPVMAEIAGCESEFRQWEPDGVTTLYGKKTNPIYGQDLGVMQINTKYWQDTADRLGLDLDDLYDNMAMGRYIYEQRGTQPWSASKYCWGS